MFPYILPAPTAHECRRVNVSRSLQAAPTRACLVCKTRVNGFEELARISWQWVRRRIFLHLLLRPGTPPRSHTRGYGVLCMVVNCFWPYFTPRSRRNSLEEGPTILVITSTEREREKAKEETFLLARNHGFEFSTCDLNIGHRRATISLSLTFRSSKIKSVLKCEYVRQHSRFEIPARIFRACVQSYFGCSSHVTFCNLRHRDVLKGTDMLQHRCFMF